MPLQFTRRAAHGALRLDCRGHTPGDSLMNDEDVKGMLNKFMVSQLNKIGNEALSVDRVHAFINDTMLPSMPEAVLADHGVFKKDGKYCVSRPTAYEWMKKAGAERGWYKANYFTDVHERADVVRDRKEYLRRDVELDMRTPVWVVLTEDDYKKLVDESGDVEKPHFFTGADGVPMVEVHVDQFADTAVRERLGPIGGRPSVRWTGAAGVRVQQCEHRHGENCKCHLPLIRIGQDESIYKAYALPKGVWRVDGMQGLRKKTDGPGEMVYGFQDEIRGFGFPMTPEELTRVNASEVRAGKPELKESPGIRFLEYGKNREGYWTYDQFVAQLLDVLDCIEVLYPDMQACFEVDHSAGAKT